MKKQRIGKIIVLIICIAIIVTSLFASKFVFYDAKMTPADYSYTKTQTKPEQAKTTFWFGYGPKRELQYGYDKGVNISDVEIFTKIGPKVIKSSNDKYDEVRGNSTGYVIAALPKQEIDIDNDGKNETVYDFARTEFGTYAYLGGPSELFNSEEIKFELMFSEYKHMEVYFNNKLVTEGTITVISENGKSKDYKINEKGQIDNLPISNIRNGFTGIYTVDGNEYYRMYYVLEGYKDFGIHYFMAYISLLLTIIYTILGIFIVCILRSLYYKKDVTYSKYATRKRNVFTHKNKMTKFQKIRWTCLLLSFFIWTFLGKILRQGQLLNSINIPTFSCPFNFDQMIESSCFYFSHLTYLFEEGLMHTIKFLGILLISLIFVGRMLCGFLCPLGMMQDLMDKIREKLNIRAIIVSDKMYKIMQPIKWVWIILFLGFTFIGGDFCDICPNKTFSPALGGYWVNLYIGGFFTVILLVGSFFIRRFWCLMCPLGYLMGVFHKFNLFKLKKDCVACTECGACYEKCPMRIKNIYTERQTENIQETDCLMCGECIDKCPEDKGLVITFLGKPIYEASRKRFISKYNTKQMIKRNERKEYK